MTLPFTNLFGSSTPVVPGGTYWWAAAFVSELTGIPSGEAFGTPSLGKIIGIEAIASGEEFGSTVLTYNQDITFTSIDEGGLGEPVVSHAENQIARTDGITSAEAFGTPELIRGWLLEVVGIESGEAFGATAIPSPPRFDAVGAGSAGNTAFGSTFSFSHDGSASAYVLVDIVVGNPVPSMSVKYGGVDMTQLASVDLGAITSQGAGHYFRYGLANIPGGTNTVAVNLGALSTYYAANSASYLGVSSIGSAVLTALTQSGALSQSTTTASSQLAVQAFAGDNSNGTQFTSVAGGTNRYNAGAQFTQLSISDSAAAAPTFTASATTSTTYPQYWLGCITKLLASVPRLEMPGIASVEAFGTAVLLVATPQTLTATGITTSEAFGTSAVGTNIAPTGIASAEAVSTGAVLLPVITPTGITSGEAFGTSVFKLFLLPTGITTGEAIGSASVAQVATPTGIASAEAFGSSTVSNASTVAYDALGAGGHNALGTSLSWSHTATAGATVLAFVSVGDVGASSITSITHDGNAMTLVGRMNDNNNGGFSGYIALYKISGVAAGAKTIALTLGSQALIDGNSVSFVNVGSVGSAITAFGSSTSLTQTVTMSGQPMCVQGFGVFRGTIATASGGTNRHRANTLSISTATATTTFTATDATSTEYGGIAALLS